MTQITLVKKIKADGSPCRKCVDIDNRLQRDGHSDRIDRIVIADERDPDSEGFRLATAHGIQSAPFFLVRSTDDEVNVYTVYLKLVREVLKAEANRFEANMDLLDQHPELDFI